MKLRKIFHEAYTFESRKILRWFPVAFGVFLVYFVGFYVWNINEDSDFEIVAGSIKMQRVAVRFHRVPRFHQGTAQSRSSSCLWGYSKGGWSKGRGKPILGNPMDEASRFSPKG